MNKKRKKLILLYACLIALLFSSCGTGLLGSTDEKETYREVQEVIFPMDNVRTLNPVATTDEDTYYITKLIYDGLFSLDERMTPVENLAQTYEFNKKRQSVTISLKNTNWHDGKTLTAEDVVFSIEAHQAMGDTNQYHSIVSGIDYSEEKGDGKVEIFFTDGENMALDMLTFPIIPSHQFEWSGEAIKAEADFKPIGTGPYMYDSYNPVDNLVLKANEDYHGIKATNKIIFDIIPGKDSRYKMVESGSLSMLYTKLPERETQIKKDSVTVKSNPRNQVIYLGFNTTRQGINQVDVRKGLAYSVDNKKIISNCYFNSAQINGSLYYPNYYGTDTSKDIYPFNDSKATEAFADAGYTVEGEDGFIYTEENQGLDLILLVNSDFPERVQAAELMAKEWEKVGISITIKAENTNSYVAALMQGAFDLFIGSYMYDEQMDLRNIIGYNGTDYTGYENDTLFEQLNDLRSGLTAKEYKETVEGINEIITDELPYYPLFYPTDGAFVSATLKGDVSPLWNNIYYNCGDWMSKYKESPKEKE